MALHPSDQRGEVHGYVVEVESSRVAQADPVLVLRFGLCEAVRASLDHEPARPAGGLGQDAVGVGDAAVADPLLAPVEPVAHHVPVLLDWSGGRLQGGEVAPGLGLSGAVREQDPLGGDARQPLLLLLCTRAHGDRIAPEERGEHARRHPHVDRRHPLADSVHVERAAAHPAVLLGDEEQLDAEIVAAHLADEVFRALVVAVEPELQVDGQVAVGELLDRIQGHFEHVRIETDVHRASFQVDTVRLPSSSWKWPWPGQRKRSRFGQPRQSTRGEHVATSRHHPER